MSRSKGPVQRITNDYSSTNVTDSAFVELDSALDNHVSEIEIFDTSGAVIELAVGAAGSEKVIPMYVFAGGMDRQPVNLSKGQRLAVQSVDTTTISSGVLYINLWG